MDRPDGVQESATALSAAPSPRAEIAELRSLGELRACVELQKEVWGPDFTEVVPSSILKVSREVGGVAAGAFAVTGELVGFVFGISGLRDGRPSHWSHMLGVRPSHQGLGIGYRLKQFQRERLLELGIREMRWTFDPLVAGNAHFNLTRLGTGVEGYLEDAYGDTGSGIHSLGTDRLVARWRLDGDSRPMGTPGDPTWHTAPLLDPKASPAPAIGDHVRIAIPSDIQLLKEKDPEAALAWRTSTRAAFQAAFRTGYRVVGFQRASAGGHCHYLLQRGPDG